MTRRRQGNVIALAERKPKPPNLPLSIEAKIAEHEKLLEIYLRLAENTRQAIAILKRLDAG